jgi:hypothetical protein
MNWRPFMGGNGGLKERRCIHGTNIYSTGLHSMKSDYRLPPHTPKISRKKEQDCGRASNGSHIKMEHCPKSVLRNCWKVLGGSGVLKELKEIKEIKELKELKEIKAIKETQHTDGKNIYSTGSQSMKSDYRLHHHTPKISMKKEQDCGRALNGSHIKMEHCHKSVLRNS